ncbi:zinc finger CCCH domain-containing protein 29-like [Impatiens glandulifera]|uniref:zinc finger CCCH domain-containing protein 29-like n=1 Tax=Impatiens glandulifera TaxID=253017 RepID=UPI001FB073EC|nr:zinc finger CCCH domain-containing protein 29-like [Impatiens glandulifera]
MGVELLELCSMDNLFEFKSAIEEKGFDIDGSSLWYGRRIIRSRTTSMAFEERTPLMIASLYGSLSVLNYIISTRKVDVSRPHGSDRATPLHCAAVSGLDSSLNVVELLLASSADVNATNANGDTPGDLIAPKLKSTDHSKRKKLESMLITRGSIPEKKEYALLPDINVGLYGTDEFRMYSFKVKPCSRAYSHDWTECPFVHPGENARRRDPRKHQYSCVPCPEFRKGSCCKADNCEYAHGVFESWLHPAQYRTRLCKDEVGCSRKVCFFAHKVDELRPVYASTGSGIPSPTSSIDVTISSSPPMVGTGSMWPRPNSHQLKTSMSGRDLELEMELLSFETLRNQQQRRQLMNEYNRINGSIGFNQLQSPYALSLKSASFANRSQSFIDRAGSGAMANPNWSSPDGKLDWGYKGEDLNKLKKSASFSYRNGNNTAKVAMMGPPPGINEQIMSRVRSSYNPKLDDGGVHDELPPWFEQFYIEQEQVVA